MLKYLSPPPLKIVSSKCTIKNTSTDRGIGSFHGIGDVHVLFNVHYFVHKYIRNFHYRMSTCSVDKGHSFHNGNFLAYTFIRFSCKFQYFSKHVECSSVNTKDVVFIIVTFLAFTLFRFSCKFY